MAYANGLIPSSALTALSTTARQALEGVAARQWDALAWSVRNAFGWLPQLTDSYRPLTVQVSLLYQRYDNTYRPGLTVGNGGVRYYAGRTWYRKPGYATVATPGNSNHGWGKAVDCTGLGGFSGTRYRQLASLAARFGYSNAAGRTINEPWHWEFTGAYSVSNPIGGGGATVPLPGVTAPDPLTPLEEDDDMLVIARTKNDPQVWIGNGVTRRRVSTQDTLKTIQFLATNGLLKVAQNGAVQSIEDMWALGHPVADDLGAVQAGVGGVPAAVWGHRLTHTTAQDASGKAAQTPAGDFLRYTSAEFDADRKVTAELVKSIPGVDPTVIAAAVKSALKGLSITLSTEG